MIIITGASRGIGNFLFNQFKDSLGEKNVIGIYNNTQPDSSVNNMFKLDVTKPEDIMAFTKENKSVLKNIVLINCAGSNYNAFGHKADPLKWAKLIQVNLIGTFNMINSLLPLMRDQEYGRIVNMSSVVAQKGIPGTSAYAASKSGLWGLAKSIAAENATKGITINNLNLGYFQIGMIDDVPEDMQENIKKVIPVKRFGNPNEIYNSVQFIIDNAYLNGTSIDINGGLI